MFWIANVCAPWLLIERTNGIERWECACARTHKTWKFIAISFNNVDSFCFILFPCPYCPWCVSVHRALTPFIHAFKCSISILFHCIMSITNIIYSYNSLISWYPWWCSPVHRIKRIEEEDEKMLRKSKRWNGHKRKPSIVFWAAKRRWIVAIVAQITDRFSFLACRGFVTVVCHWMKSHISNDLAEISYLKWSEVKWHINKINSIEIKLFHKIPFYNSIIDDHHSLKLLSI